MTTRTKIASALLALTFVFSATAWPQDAPTSGNTSYLKSPEHYFELTFRVLDISPSGRLADTKTYKEIIASGPKSSNPSRIRTSDRVQIAVGGKFPNGEPAISAFELGTKIDANLAAMLSDSLRLHVTASISSISTAAPGDAQRPLIRQTTWDSNVIVPIGKPTIIFSSDNSADKGRTELELTARQISQ